MGERSDIEGLGKGNSGVLHFEGAYLSVSSSRPKAGHAGMQSSLISTKIT